MSELSEETRPKRLTAWLPAWLLSRTRKEAKKRGLTMTALIINGLYKELEIRPNEPTVETQN